MPELFEGLKFVFDTTLLSNFAIVEQVGLLETLYRDIACTTLMVVEELQQGLYAGYHQLQSVEQILTPFHTAGWLPVLSLERAEEKRLYAQLSPPLASGEASCLAIAITREFVLGSDDLAARRMATGRNVHLTGTIGILIRAVREGYCALPKANDMLAQMIAQRYRAPVARLDDLI
jgi:predicted nucleic acid-binding protein